MQILEIFKPKIDKKKLTIGPTPYLETLYLKVGYRVMLTINLDVKDGLCNGSIGTLMAAVRVENGAVGVLLVMFDDERCGREMRRCHPQLNKFFQDLLLSRNRSISTLHPRVVRDLKWMQL